MPVNMTVPLLTTQRQNIKPLCRNALPDCLCRLINSSLKREVFITRKVARDLFLMLNGSDQCIPIKNGILVEKHYEFIILMDNMISTQATRDHLTDKAWIALNAFNIRVKIKGLSIHQGLPWLSDPVPTIITGNLSVNERANRLPPQCGKECLWIP